MESNNVEPSSGRFENLKKVTPLSKYLAMAVFIIMPFIGGLIGYTYAPVKIMEVDILSNSTQPTTSELSIDSSLISDRNQEYEFSLTPYRGEQKDLEAGPDWVNVYNSSEELKYSFIGGEVINGEHCYLGLCSVDSEETFTTENNVVWNKINTTDCVGGCEAIQYLYRTTENNKNYYFIIWDKADEKDGLEILKTFKWKHGENNKNTSS